MRVAATVCVAVAGGVDRNPINLQQLRVGTAETLGIFRGRLYAPALASECAFECVGCQTDWRITVDGLTGCERVEASGTGGRRCSLKVDPDYTGEPLTLVTFSMVDWVPAEVADRVDRLHDCTSIACERSLFACRNTRVDGEARFCHRGHFRGMSSSSRENLSQRAQLGPGAIRFAAVLPPDSPRVEPSFLQYLGVILSPLWPSLLVAAIFFANGVRLRFRARYPHRFVRELVLQTLHNLDSEIQRERWHSIKADLTDVLALRRSARTVVIAAVPMVPQLPAVLALYAALPIAFIEGFAELYLPPVLHLGPLRRLGSHLLLLVLLLAFVWPVLSGLSYDRHDEEGGWNWLRYLMIGQTWWGGLVLLPAAIWMMVRLGGDQLPSTARRPRLVCAIAYVSVFMVAPVVEVISLLPYIQDDPWLEFLIDADLKGKRPEYNSGEGDDDVLEDGVPSSVIDDYLYFFLYNLAFGIVGVVGLVALFAPDAKPDEGEEGGDGDGQVNKGGSLLVKGVGGKLFQISKLFPIGSTESGSKRMMWPVGRLTTFIPKISSFRATSDRATDRSTDYQLPSEVLPKLSLEPPLSPSGFDLTSPAATAKTTTGPPPSPPPSPSQAEQPGARSQGAVRCCAEAAAAAVRNRRPIGGCVALLMWSLGTLVPYWLSRHNEHVQNISVYSTILRLLAVVVAAAVLGLCCRSYRSTGPGTKWKALGGKTTKGNEITSEALSTGLLKKQTFTQAEVKAFELKDLKVDSFVQVGGRYYEQAGRAGGALFTLHGAPGLAPHGVTPPSAPSASHNGHTKFVGRRLVMGQPSEAATGLFRFIRCDEHKVARAQATDGLEAMLQEWKSLENVDPADLDNLEYVAHQAAGSSERTFHNGWKRDRAPDGVQYLPARVRRDGTGYTLDDFVRHPSSVAAGLTRAHIFALRLYTTSSFKAINEPLRKLKRTVTGEISYPPKLEAPHPLPITLTYLSDALKKLRVVATVDAKAEKHRTPSKSCKSRSPSVGAALGEGGVSLGTELSRPRRSSAAGSVAAAGAPASTMSISPLPSPPPSPPDHGDAVALLEAGMPPATAEATSGAVGRRSRPSLQPPTSPASAMQRGSQPSHGNRVEGLRHGARTAAGSHGSRGDGRTHAIHSGTTDERSSAGDRRTTGAAATGRTRSLSRQESLASRGAAESHATSGRPSDHMGNRESVWVAARRQSVATLREVRAFVLDEAAEKGQQRVLWRGMRDLRASQAFLSAGGSELAPCSTTDDLSTALRYARGGESALLFRLIVPSFINLGADLTFLSAFPHEREYLYPPLTYVRPTGTVHTLKYEGTEYSVVDCEPSFPT